VGLPIICGLITLLCVQCYVNRPLYQESQPLSYRGIIVQIYIQPSLGLDDPKEFLHSTFRKKQAMQPIYATYDVKRFIVEWQRFIQINSGKGNIQKFEVTGVNIRRVNIPSPFN
jgi:hypothetical protein